MHVDAGKCPKSRLAGEALAELLGRGEARAARSRRGTLGQGGVEGRSRAQQAFARACRTEPACSRRQGDRDRKPRSILGVFCNLEHENTLSSNENSSLDHSKMFYCTCGGRVPNRTLEIVFAEEGKLRASRPTTLDSGGPESQDWGPHKRRSYVEAGREPGAGRGAGGRAACPGAGLVLWSGEELLLLQLSGAVVLVTAVPGDLGSEAFSLICVASGGV